MDKIIERLDKAIIEAGDEINALDLNDNTDLIDDLGFNSINIISLVVCLESEFGIEIPEEYLLLEKLRSYKEIKNMIISKIENNFSPALNLK